MGQCVYCGQSAGILRNKHKECEQRNQWGKRQVISLVGNIGSNGGNLQQLESKVEEAANKSFIDSRMLRDLVVSGWEQAVESAFEDGVLTEQEEASLCELKDHFSLSQDILDRNGACTKIAKGAVLRDIFEGNLPDRVKINGTLPFNLQKTEAIVWVFQDVGYYEQKMRTRYVGGTQGVSVRIAKGFYYRVGGFKGERVQTSETVLADTGLLGVTNKHVYFSGLSKRFRIPYSKIVAFEPYSDGIGMQRDAVSARPQTFVTGDGWFTYNLIANLAQM